MTINFSFVLFFFAFLLICPLRATTHAIDSLPSWSIIPHVGIALERVVFWSKGHLCHFCQQEWVVAQRIIEKWAIVFSINMPQGINQGWFWNIMVSGFVFLVIEKRFGRLEAVASLDAYQITKNQILQNSFFCCLIFEEFEKEFLNQEFYHPLPKQAWSKSSFDFFKIVPLKVPRFFRSNDSIVKESVYQDKLITNNDHQSLQDPGYSKLGNIFHFFSFFWHWNLFPL